ncbi:hypothetical protein F2Q70_00035670 [Brassica cretica]|uniref:Uncharacterized protein n=1 Tax=Brassica cretica TaxID=69181 RepID=A0A8S9JSU4_BRACR|nr:hypothetical protein F2Q70_00035670 [Brassica cretica]
MFLAMSKARADLLSLEIPHFDHVFGECEKRVDEGTVIRLAPEQWDAILDQPIEVRFRNKLQPKDRFKVVSGKGETMLIAQDHDANEMLKTGGIQLAYRYLETVQHTDYDFRDRKPQATVHLE